MSGLSVLVICTILIVVCSARNLGKTEDDYMRVMKRDYDPLADQCEVSDDEKLQCGKTTYDEDECLKRGCCYKVIEGCTEKPWCFLARRMMREECQVSYENKDDCGYYGISEGECYLRGCCWAPASLTNEPSCFKAISVRLVDGEKTEGSLSGRVEVSYKGVWGTVCDDNFNQNAADVVCRSLGYPFAEPFGYSEFGQGTGPIWLDGMRCNGEEERLEDCSHNGWGEHDCRHYEDAGAVCSKVEAVPYEYPDYSEYYYPYYYYYEDYKQMSDAKRSKKHDIPLRKGIANIKHPKLAKEIQDIKDARPRQMKDTLLTTHHKRLGKTPMDRLKETLRHKESFMKEKQRRGMPNPPDAKKITV